MDTDDDTGSDVVTEAIKLLELDVLDYKSALEECTVSLFDDMAGHGLMSSFNDNLYLDDWKVTIDPLPKQRIPVSTGTEPQL